MAFCRVRVEFSHAVVPLVEICQNRANESLLEFATLFSIAAFYGRTLFAVFLNAGLNLAYGNLVARRFCW